VAVSGGELRPILPVADWEEDTRLMAGLNGTASVADVLQASAGSLGSVRSACTIVGSGIELADGLSELWSVTAVTGASGIFTEAAAGSFESVGGICAVVDTGAVAPAAALSDEVCSATAATGTSGIFPGSAVEFCAVCASDLTSF
jgi:hypothetical protein